MLFAINTYAKCPCCCDDGLFLVKGQYFPLWGITPRLDINQIALDNEGYSTQKITYVGNLVIRIGILREDYSYTWIFERNVSSKHITIEELRIPFQGIDFGKIEVALYAHSDSALFYNDFDTCNIVENYNYDNLLYNFTNPSLDLCSEVPLYYKFSNETSFYSFEKKCAIMSKETDLDLTTYFNAFSACKWGKYTNISTIKIGFDFQGEALVHIIHHSKNKSIILKKLLISCEKRTKFISPAIEIPADGIIGCQIFAQKDSIFFGGGYFADAEETQTVNLGIGITTYKREKSVKDAVARLSSAIQKHPLYSNVIITVVDNGKSLSENDIKGATLIPNKNLGGTGGFMRNLIAYKENKLITHCLFMDDDAHCEAESIFRAISFLRHAKDTDLALSGAMLSDSLKFLQWENGAWFDGCCHPLHCRYDLTRLEFLIKNEAEETKPIYGAWWFFVFPIKKITKYSFPFFVRGDDVEFSYKNNLKIARMNGIGTWQEDFSLKASPMTRYLDTRSGIILQMTLPHTRTNPWKIIQLVWNFFWNPNLSYMYDSANAVVMAFADTLDGPSYWKNNMEMSAIRKKVKEKYSIESESPLSSHYEQIPLADKNIQLKIFTKALRKLTFNGHLIPSRFFKKEVERINKQQLPFYNRVFLRDKICVCDIISKKQYFLKKNTAYFVKNLTLFIYTTIKFILKYHFLKKEYNNFVKSLTPDFWNKNF